MIFSIFVNNWPSGWGKVFFHIFVVGRYPSVIKGCMLPSQVPWAEEEHVLGLVTGASGVSQALVLDPPPSPTLLVEHLQIYSHIFQLTFLVIPVTVHHHHCLNQGHFLLLHFKTVFPFYFFILRSFHSGIWKEIISRSSRILLCLCRTFKEICNLPIQKQSWYLFRDLTWLRNRLLWLNYHNILLPFLFWFLKPRPGACLCALVWQWQLRGPLRNSEIENLRRLGKFFTFSVFPSHPMMIKIVWFDVLMLYQSSPAPNSSSARHSSRPTRLVHPSTSNRPGPSLLCPFCCLLPLKYNNKNKIFVDCCPPCREYRRPACSS